VERMRIDEIKGIKHTYTIIYINIFIYKKRKKTKRIKNVKNSKRLYSQNSNEDPLKLDKLEKK